MKGPVKEDHFLPNPAASWVSNLFYYQLSLIPFRPASLGTFLTVIKYFHLTKIVFLNVISRPQSLCSHTDM